MQQAKILAQPMGLRLRSRWAAVGLALAVTFAAIGAMPASMHAAQAGPTLPSLTGNLIDLIDQHGKAADHLKPAILARLQNIAAQRYHRLAAAIESDPGAVLQVALSGALRQSAPASVRNFIEEQVEMDGELEVLHEDRDQGSRFVYKLKALDCGAAVIGGTCTSSDYGDVLDVMGSSSYHNAFQKERLGWLNYGASPPIISASSNGSYPIYPLETLGNNPKAVKILKSTNTSTGKSAYYYAECRQPIGFDVGLSSNANVLNGLVIHTGDEAGVTAAICLT